MAARTSSRLSRSPMLVGDTSRPAGILFGGFGLAPAKEDPFDKADDGDRANDDEFPALFEEQEQGSQQTGFRGHGHGATSHQCGQAVLGEFVALMIFGVSFAGLVGVASQ